MSLSTISYAKGPTRCPMHYKTKNSELKRIFFCHYSVQNSTSKRISNWVTRRCFITSSTICYNAKYPHHHLSHSLCMLSRIFICVIAVRASTNFFQQLFFPSVLFTQLLPSQSHQPLSSLLS